VAARHQARTRKSRYGLCTPLSALAVLHSTTSMSAPGSRPSWRPPLVGTRTRKTDSSAPRSLRTRHHSCRRFSPVPRTALGTPAGASRAGNSLTVRGIRRPLEVIRHRVTRYMRQLNGDLDYPPLYFWRTLDLGMTTGCPRRSTKSRLQRRRQTRCSRTKTIWQRTPDAMCDSLSLYPCRPNRLWCPLIPYP